MLGDEHPQFGLARNSWLSGTATWSYLAATQWILGIRPDYDGLRIEPCIPSAGDGFAVSRRFRGKQLEIRVYNPLHKNKGVARLVVDNQALPGNLVKANLPGEPHRVEDWLS